MSEMKPTLEDEAVALQVALHAILRWDIENVIPDGLFRCAKAALRPQFAPSRINADLLESLEEAVRWIGQLNDWAGAGDPDIDTWRAAIEKAKGGAKC